MPLNIHALMQDTYDQQALFFRDVKDYMGLVFKPLKFRSELRGTAPLGWVIRQSNKALMQTEEIGFCLGQPKIQNRVFVDFVKIGRRLGGKPISGHWL